MKGVIKPRLNLTPFLAFKRVIKRKFLADILIKLTKRIFNKKWKDLGSGSISDNPYDLTMVQFRFFIEHDCLATNLHRFKMVLAYTAPSVEWLR
ncbi:hypothetical protein TNCV_905471 [Trichonephila clavipes]|nr:hypothetical protein TNCV_905471 [Trichonephila clavipes]